ncbi:MAG: putative hydro-lyase [Treponema sp.]|jgi:uncharacterized protein YcsI (UPF0317 family)|nr:putative hydro-lyase [Treponema sp.]
MIDYVNMPPKEARTLIREGKYTKQTSGMCAGYAQANLAVLPAEYAYDFLLFTQRNPKSCPVLEVSDKGSRNLNSIAPGADIATDIPQYRIYKNGVLEGEYTDVAHYWREDFVSFLIGCSFSFESELLAADVPVRHIEEDRNVPMYITSIDCVPAGIFHGKMVVSMRPLPPDQVVKSVAVTASMPRVHGAPVHIGDPEVIGIKDIHKPDFGDRVTIHPGEVPVFWACGVTPQSVVMSAKPSIAITHAPGHMLITDVKNTLLKF